MQAFGLTDVDPERSKRLAVGYAGAVALCALLALGASAIRGQAPRAEEDTIEVKLATTAAAPKPAAPPPPPPPAEAEPPKPAPPGPRKRAPAPPPTAIPKEAPPEADPSTAKAVHAPGDDSREPGSPDGAPFGTGTASPAPTAPPPPPPPAPPRPLGPIQLPENATPPVAISNPQPIYPEEARGKIEATVVVKFVVTETGDVSNVVIVKGHPLFDAAVLAAIRAWRFRPALFEGRPIPVFRVVRIPFKIKT
jgi:periplasmic protein TonB